MIIGLDVDRFVQFVHGYSRDGAVLPEEWAMVDLLARGGITEVEPTVALVGVAREVSGRRGEELTVPETLGAPMRMI